MKTDFDRPLDRRNTCSLKWDYCERILGEPDVIPMWVADMDFPAPPPVVEALTARAAHPAYGYPLAPASFWQSIISWLKTRHGWEVDRGWLTLGPGVVPSLSFCVRALTQPGDGVVVQTPVYFPFFSAVEKNGRRLIRNSLRFEGGRWAMDFDDLARKLDQGARLLILCSPHNPVGRVWTREELTEVGRLCRERDVLVVSDEIHADIVFKPHRHVPFALLSPNLAGRTITCWAPSKAFNLPGLNTSFVVAANRKLLDLYRLESQRAGFEMGNVFGLTALEAAYTHGAEWLDEAIAYVAANADFAAEFIRAKLPVLDFIRPEGTFLGLFDCRRLGLDDKALGEFFLRRAKVYFNAGPRFGAEAAGFVRVNIACPRSRLAEALERIARALESPGPPDSK
ncbi:MAG: aminotransferase class [Candidatus Aminicenantes bacterium]|nr:aminotransferase class [Candidatus Aminicenantes bacterium]